jgi:hypothetical protein
VSTSLKGVERILQPASLPTADLIEQGTLGQFRVIFVVPHLFDHSIGHTELKIRHQRVGADLVAPLKHPSRVSLA